MLCYTNHALDQFLVSLLHEMPEIKDQMVRLGSRSKDDRTSELMLWEKSKGMDRQGTKGEKSREWDIRTQQDGLRRTMTSRHMILTTQNLSFRQLVSPRLSCNLVED